MISLIIVAVLIVIVVAIISIPLYFYNYNMVLGAPVITEDLQIISDSENKILNERKLIDTATNEVYSTNSTAEIDILAQVYAILEAEAQAQNDNFILLQHADHNVTLYSIGYAYEDYDIGPDGLPAKLNPITEYNSTSALLGPNGVADKLVSEREELRDLE